MNEQSELRRCLTCKRFKHVDFFQGKCKRCRTCNNITHAEYRRTEHYKAWRREYVKRPHVKEKNRKVKQKYNKSKKGITTFIKYENTELRQTRKARNKARWRMGKATDPVRIEAWKVRIAALESRVAVLESADKAAREANGEPHDDD